MPNFIFSINHTINHLFISMSLIKFIIIAGCLIGWIFLLMPSIEYLFTAWKTRFETLKAALDENSLNLYFKQFHPSEIIGQHKPVSILFKKQYFQHYGKRRYIIPLILLGIISGLGIFLTAHDLFVWLHIYSIPLVTIPPIAISAFLGAYMWVAIDQHQRFRNRNLTYHDVYFCSVRFLISIPLGISFAALFNNNQTIGISIAFFLGTFPMQPW